MDIICPIKYIDLSHLRVQVYKLKLRIVWNRVAPQECMADAAKNAASQLCFDQF